jgi:hypothetical protein
MEFLPYSIEHGSQNIEIYMNKFHSLLTFTTEEQGKEFLKEKALEKVRYEEGAKAAENCTYSDEEDPYTFKEGLFIRELSNGYSLQSKVSGRVYGYEIHPISYYLLKSFTRPVSKPTTSVLCDVNKPSGYNAVLAELTSKVNAKLKRTGNLETLLQKDQREVEQRSSELVAPTFEDELFEDDVNQGEDEIELPALPSLKKLQQRIEAEESEESSDYEDSDDFSTEEIDVPVMLKEETSQISELKEEIEKLDKRGEEIRKEERRIEEELENYHRIRSAIWYYETSDEEDEEVYQPQYYRHSYFY